MIVNIRSSEVNSVLITCLWMILNVDVGVIFNFQFILDGYSKSLTPSQSLTAGDDERRIFAGDEEHAHVHAHFHCFVIVVL